MGEQNIGTILDSVERVYRNYRRNGIYRCQKWKQHRLNVFYPDVTSTLTTLIIDGISSHSSLLDSYVVLYAAFMSSLHKIVGIKFGKNYLMNWKFFDSLIPELIVHSFLSFSTSRSFRPNPSRFLWTSLRFFARHYYHIIYRLHRHWTRWQRMLEFTDVDLWTLQFSSGFINTHIWCHSSPSERGFYGAQSGTVAEDLAK